VEVATAGAVGWLWWSIMVFDRFEFLNRLYSDLESVFPGPSALSALSSSFQLLGVGVHLGHGWRLDHE
jgi:hypothetical protein